MTEYTITLLEELTLQMIVYLEFLLSTMASLSSASGMAVMSSMGGLAVSTLSMKQVASMSVQPTMMMVLTCGAESRTRLCIQVCNVVIIN